MTLKSFLMIGAVAAGLGASPIVATPALADGFPAGVSNPYGPLPVRPKAKPVRRATRVRIVERPVVIEKIVKVPVYVDHPVEKIVEKPVYVDRPVDRIVEKVINVPVDRPVYVDRPVDRIVERRVEVPVVKVVDRPVYIDRPVDRIIEKRVEVPVDRPVYIERKVYVDRAPPAPRYEERHDDRHVGGAAVVYESSESEYQSESYSSSSEESRWRQGQAYGQAYDYNPMTGQPDYLMTGLNVYGTTARYGAHGGWIPRVQSGSTSAWGMSRAYGSATASSSARASASASVHVGGSTHGGGGGGCGSCRH